MSEGYPTRRWAERRRPFDRHEARIVRLALDDPSVPQRVVDALRYVVAFGRLTTVRNRDGVDVELGRRLQAHALRLDDAVRARLDGADSLWEAIRALPEWASWTRVARRDVLEHEPLDRESLDEELTTRRLVVASGGGGGAGYGYLGCYRALERANLVPALLVGTSIGALTSLFRGRRRHYDLAPAVEAARRLAWGDVLRVLELESRYGLPATLRLYLRAALGHAFLLPDGQPMWLSHMEIPVQVVATGITLDALKHDLAFYERLLDDELRRPSPFAGVRSVVRSANIVREFLATPDALRRVVLGRQSGTEDFDALDAAGFSSAIPGVLHYDVLRDDPRMKRILDELYASEGITRLGEGGLVSNVPARTAWETAVSGQFGRRQAVVLALDCFAPTTRRLAWMPFMQLVRSANVDRDRRYADCYVPLSRTLSPANVVPSLPDAMQAMDWGHSDLDPHLPFLKAMCRTTEVLGDDVEAALVR